MKKLITICLIMAATFSVNAQNDEPNKEETVKYIKDLLLANCGQIRTVGNWVTDVTLDRSVLQIKMGYSSGETSVDRYDLKGYGNFVAKKDRKYDFFHIYYKDEIMMYGLILNSDARRMQNALTHLQDILNSDGTKDPFGN